MILVETLSLLLKIILSFLMKMQYLRFYSVNTKLTINFLLICIFKDPDKSTISVTNETQRSYRAKQISYTAKLQPIIEEPDLIIFTEL